tara:strand:+ start:2314 stop:2904 length:591 start_codon:yes stop_codon:yes gene_type:complete
MKNLFKSSLLIFAILITNVSFAKDVDPSFKIKLIETKLIHLTMNGNGKLVEVSVKDSNGEIIYSEKSENFDISKKYDLKLLPKGSYFMEIESPTKIKVIPFKVLFKTIDLKEEDEVTYYKPTVRKEGTDVFISKLALNNENLEIFLYDVDSNILFTEKLEGNAILKRKLNLMNLNSGDYNLVLRSNGKIFYETIKL